MIDDLGIKIGCRIQSKTKTYVNGALWTRRGRFIAWLRRKVLGQIIVHAPTRVYRSKIKRFGKVD